MPAKYQNEIRSMFISVFAQDHFYRDVDPDDAIGMVMGEMGRTYQSISDSLEIGVSNGIPVSEELELVAVAIGVWLEV